MSPIARLARHDLSRNDSSVVWSVPYLGAFEKISLMHVVGDELQLLASNGKELVGWQLALHDGTLDFGGTFREELQLLDEPIKGLDAILVPASMDGKLHYLRLSNERFAPGNPCSSL